MSGSLLALSLFFFNVVCLPLPCGSFYRKHAHMQTKMVFFSSKPLLKLLSMLMIFSTR